MVSAKALIIVWIIAFMLGFADFIDAAEKDIKSTGKQSPQQTFISCHASSADLSPDGRVFVSLDPQSPILNIFDMGVEAKSTQIKLPKRANDVVAIGKDQAVVSYGLSGDLAMVDFKKGMVHPSFKIGASAEGMCRISDGRVIVISSRENKIILVDPGSQRVLKIFPVLFKPAQMRWIIPDWQIEVVDAQAKKRSVIELPPPKNSSGQAEGPGNKFFGF